MDASKLAWLESTFEKYRTQLLRYAVKMTGDLKETQPTKTYSPLREAEQAKINSVTDKSSSAWLKKHPPSQETINSKNPS